MSKLTESERTGFNEILKQDLRAINSAFMSQIKDFWKMARAEVMKEKGWDKLEEEKHKLQEIIRESKQKINEIENTLNSEDLRPEQVVELGGKANEFGRFNGSNFYDIPITSQFEYEIVQYIKKRINLDVPAKILGDICKASIRELTMSGTFEEARESYQKFYGLDFRKYGVDIPPRLEEITKNKKLLEMAQEPLQLTDNNGVSSSKEKPKLVEDFVQKVDR